MKKEAYANSTINAVDSARYLWIVLPLYLASTFLREIGITAASNLGLEQVPQARGTYVIERYVWVFGRGYRNRYWRNRTERVH